MEPFGRLIFRTISLFRGFEPLKDKTEEQFARINAMFEEFKLNTITKAEFVAGIEDKADRDEIANIVSSRQQSLFKF